KKYLEELAKIDPESVKRANSFFPLPTSKPAVTNSNEGKEGAPSKPPSATAGSAEGKTPAADASSGSGANGGAAEGKLNDSSALSSPSGDTLARADGVSGAVPTAAVTESSDKMSATPGDGRALQTRWSAAKPNVARAEEMQTETTTAGRQSERQLSPDSPPAHRTVSDTETSTAWHALAGTAGAGVCVFALLMTIFRGNG
ncbi:MAG: hypothetical protein ACREJM_08925, partial [Candidatus Saccharimonadales bacterium]